MLLKFFPKSNLSNFINLLICLIPFSMILGNTAINLNIILVSLIGLYLIFQNNFKVEFNLITKGIFVFMLIATLSSLLSIDIKSPAKDLSSSYFENFIKSLLYFRWLLFLIVIQNLNKYKVINFRFLLYSFSFFAVLVSVDIIFQNFMGFNLFGFPKFITPLHGHEINTGFFGDEIIAGGFIQRFSFFFIFLLIIYLEKKNNYFKYFIFPLFISLFPFSIFLSTNRMPLIMYIVGILLLGIIYRKYLLQIILGILIFLFLAFSLGTERQKTSYESMYSNIKNLKSMLYQFKTLDVNGIQKRTMTAEDVSSKSGSGHLYIYNTVFNIWKDNKFLGIGPKNFYEKCVESEHHLNRLCVSHPHNYSLDILVSTGMIGIILATIIALNLLFLSFKKILSKTFFSKKEDLILVPALIVFILEIFPLRSTGGFFTSGTAVYIFLILSIILCTKFKIKND